MSALETAMEELKTLDPSQLEEVVGHLRATRERAVSARLEAWRRTRASLSPEEADEMIKHIEESGERIDPA